MALFLSEPHSVHAQTSAQDVGNKVAGNESPDDAWFAEGRIENDAVATLANGATSILLKRVDWGAGKRTDAGKALKGIFENVEAWQVARIPVCFLGINDALGLEKQDFQALKIDIAAIASEWNTVEGVPDFDFGTPGSPNDCSGQGYMVAVEITEEPSFSSIGKAGMIYASLGMRTMNLQLSQLQSNTPGMLRHLVLHEFGHALGLRHEIKHAGDNCWSKFDEDKLYAYYAKELKVTNRSGIKTKLDRFDRITFATLTSTDIDQRSVMMYSFPKSVYVDASPPCWTPLNTEISPGDRLTLQKAYRVLGVGTMQLASLSAELSEPHRRVVDAFIALQTAPPEAQAELLRALQQVEDNASSKQLADSVFATAHSPAFQQILMNEEIMQATQSE